MGAKKSNERRLNNKEERERKLEMWNSFGLWGPLVL
jgi:hypothetical protein